MTSKDTSNDPNEVADIHNRLDEIARQIGDIQRTTTAESGNKTAAEQVGPAMSRLDARLSRLSTPTTAASSSASAEPATAPDFGSLSLDEAIAEISARQSELSRDTSVRSAAAAMPPKSREPDFSSLHQQLVHITSQIEALKQPTGLEESIAEFRSELAEIRKAVTQALPAHAIESLETEIRTLTRRLDDSRAAGADAITLAGVERALIETREALRTLTPAEKLTGFDDAISGLGSRIDTIMRASDDPATVRQLEDAISALRSVVSNIASSETLERLGADVHALSSRIDELTKAQDHDGLLTTLEQRISALASGIDHGTHSESGVNVEKGFQALADRLDTLKVGTTETDTFVHLEQRISTLLERLEASSGRPNDLTRVENGLSEVLAHLELQRSSIEALQLPASRQAFSGEQDTPSDTTAMVSIHQELSDIRFNQSENDRLTQDALEVVHTTLGHVVDRLAVIEGDLRVSSSQNETGPASPAAGIKASHAQHRPELPNPVRPKDDPPPPPTGGGQRTMLGVADVTTPPASQPGFDSDTTRPTNLRSDMPPTGMPASGLSRTRPPIDPALPPDHPLEPGNWSADTSQLAAKSEHSAADIRSSDISSDHPVATTSNFIAAARRAAQAAAMPPPDKPSRVTALADVARNAAKAAAKTATLAVPTTSTFTSRIRTLLVGTGIVVVALGAFKIATIMIDPGGHAEHMPPMSMDDLANISEPGQSATPELGKPVPPSLTSPTPLEQQSRSGPAYDTSPDDITGTITTPQDVSPPAPADSIAPGFVTIPQSEKLPDAIGGPVLRAAALRGNPAAAYQVGARYAEGKGIPVSYAEAVKWYQRAAEGGIVPAIFRLGTFYEKGLGVTKNLDTARDYYLRAAKRGNAKAMHNLAVLYADGGGNGADYRSAAQWFFKAANHGVADSQYNLGILHARGIGMEQNLVESYKWFSLAAAQGDIDAGSKRDEVAKRLDAQALAAAKKAVQAFKADIQPDDAINVIAPAGGWDAANAKPRGGVRTIALNRAH